MTYTVNQLAKIAGISVRTLHYYDQIGLLSPGFVMENGYRYYGDPELSKLQQILFFRELEFSLEKIKQIITSPKFNELEAMENHRKLLQLKKQRADRLLKTIDKTIKSLKGDASAENLIEGLPSKSGGMPPEVLTKGGETMSNSDKFSAFNDPTYQQHKTEVEQRWGNTDAYKQSQQRVGKMTKADLDKVKAQQQDIWQTGAKLMNEGHSFDSPQVQQQVDRFYKHLSNFYDPNYEMFKGLGQMYVDDPRFTKVYEDMSEGYAKFMRDAMAYYSDNHTK